MNNGLPRMRCQLVWLLIMVPALALAQVPTPKGQEDALSDATAIAKPVPADAPAPTPVPAIKDCRAITDKATTVDLNAVTARAKKEDLATQAKLFAEAGTLWSMAAQHCVGRAKERALRNQEDDQNMLAQVTEQLNAGPQCAAAHKNATALQEIARQTLSERRWPEAAALFRKAESMWELATERCSGSQQDTANRHREQSEMDGHNAEFCAPLFERAREHTQRLRSSATTLSPENKQDASQIAETLWRDAVKNCHGSAVQDLAANNATALARERGTPWVARVAPAGKVTHRPVADARSSKKADQQPAAVPATVLATEANTPSVARPVSSPASGPGPGGPASAALATETAGAGVPQAGVLTAGGTRFIGHFARDAGATSVSGNGKVIWASGDVFEGTLQKGLRHGKGTITWANGQRYDGDWVNGEPTGQASVNFANGNQYQGSVIDGIPEGSGHMRYASGDVFDGQFKAGEPDLRGIYVWRNGQRYDGSWKNGRPNGEGKLKFATGNQFQGTVLDGVPHGEGRMEFAAGETYSGHFSSGEPDGEGSFTWPSGDHYVGQWKAGKKHGQGVFTWKSGDRWEGVYDNDVQVK